MKKINSIQEETRKCFASEIDSIEPLFHWDMIEEFYKFLNDKNIEGGFFSKNDSDNIAKRHIIESIYYVYKIYELGYLYGIKKIADVGTGPGLPGFLFACMKDQMHLTLIDSAKRKLGLTEKWISESKKSKILNVNFENYFHIIYDRAEDWKDKKAEKFDLVTMRATIPYPFSIEVICGMVNLKGYFLPFLGRECNWKSTENKILSYTGFRIVNELELQSLGFLGERKIKVLKKIGSEKHGIPREWKIISREIKDAEWVK